MKPKVYKIGEIVTINGTEFEVKEPNDGYNLDKFVVGIVSTNPVREGYKPKVQYIDITYLD